MDQLKIKVYTPPGQAKPSEAKLRRDIFLYGSQEIRTEIVSDKEFVWYWTPKDDKDQARVIKSLGKAEIRIKKSLRILVRLLVRAQKLRVRAGWAAKKFRRFVEARWRKLAGNDEMPDGFVFDQESDSGELEGLDDMNIFLGGPMFEVEVVDDE